MTLARRIMVVYSRGQRSRAIRALRAFAREHPDADWEAIEC